VSLTPVLPSPATAPRTSPRSPYRTALAGAAEVDAAQRLRHRVSAGELGVPLSPGSATSVRDVDEWGELCDRLVVRDQWTDEVAGTYRLQPPERALAVGPGRRGPTRGAPPAGRGSMSAWMPVSACESACAEAGGPWVGPAARRRRLRRLAGTLLAAVLRVALWAGAGKQAQRRVAVCSAAGVLTALGIRVEVVNPAVPWPRARVGHLIVSNHVSWLDDLALLIAVRATPVAKAELANWPVLGGLARRLGVIFVERGRLRSVAASVDEIVGRLRRGESVSVHPEGTTTYGVQLERFRPAFFQAAVHAGAAVCPVAIRYRVDGGAASTLPGYLRGDTLGRSIARVVAARGLVVEVHLLPALDANGGDRRTLAALTEYAVAGGPTSADVDQPPSMAVTASLSQAAMPVFTR
jgi:1-acyl-sn-glycerol-3-phosphate acyltransferase